MKDVLVTLGKIEERFGEKLNSLSDKISHLDNVSSEKSKKIQEQKEDKDKIINELMDKAHLNTQEKETYKKQLEEKDFQIEILKREQYIARKRASDLRSKDGWEPNNRALMLLLNGDTSRFSRATINKLKKLGYLDNIGNVDENRIIDRLANKKQQNSINSY